MTLDLSLIAKVQVPDTADIPGVVRAAGGDPAYALYADGWLTVRGVTQQALEDAAGAADPLYAPRAARNLAAQQELVRRVSEGMPFRGKVLDIDEDKSQRRMTSAAVASLLGEISDTDTVTWVTADNTPLVLDGAGVKIMSRMVFRYFKALNEYYWFLRASIAVASTAEDLASLDPTAGWPDPPDEEPLP